ncbi:MAG: hypothetical protein DDT25_00634 [Chloroflexi bacterium]|nr:hypothetical protein [Chloroflexota bacterium]
MITSGRKSAITPIMAALSSKAPSQEFQCRSRLPKRPRHSIQATITIHISIGITASPNDLSITLAMVSWRKNSTPTVRATSTTRRNSPDITDRKVRRRMLFLRDPVRLRLVLTFAIILAGSR